MVFIFGCVLIQKHQSNEAVEGSVNPESSKRQASLSSHQIVNRGKLSLSERTADPKLSSVAVTPAPSEPGVNPEAGSRNRFELQSRTYPKSKTSDYDLSAALESEIQSHTWVGGGFQPPSTSDFDELFRNQRKKTGFTYTGLPILDGVYGGEFGSDAGSGQLFFTALLKLITSNNRTGLQGNWLQWNGQKKVDLTAFQSEFSENEIYYGFIHLPTSLFQLQGIEVGNCIEILIIRHFDHNWEDNRQNVEFFNARTYCRRGLDDLIYIGRAGFELLSTSTPKQINRL